MTGVDQPWRADSAYPASRGLEEDEVWEAQVSLFQTREASQA